MTLRARLVDALAPHDLTHGLARAIAEALQGYRRSRVGADAVAQRAKQRAAIERADEATARLVSALANIDQAFGQSTPDPSVPTPTGRRPHFVFDTHHGLAREAAACRKTWRSVLNRRKPPPAHRDADADRRVLGVAVVHALMDAGLPARPADGHLQDVLRVVLAKADAIDGRPERRRRDLYRTARAWVRIAVAINRGMIEVGDRR